MRRHRASLSRSKRSEFPCMCMIICITGRTILSWWEHVLPGQGQRQLWETVNLQPKPHSSHNYKRQKLFLWQQPSGEMLFPIIDHPYSFWKNCTHNKHCNQKILLGDLSMREDIVQYSVHVTLVLLSKGEHTFVIVTYKQQKALSNVLHAKLRLHRVVDALNSSPTLYCPLPSSIPVTAFKNKIGKKWSQKYQ